MTGTGKKQQCNAFCLLSLHWSRMAFCVLLRLAAISYSVVSIQENNVFIAYLSTKQPLVWVLSFMNGHLWNWLCLELPIVNAVVSLWMKLIFIRNYRCVSKTKLVTYLRVEENTMCCQTLLSSAVWFQNEWHGGEKARTCAVTLL